MKRMLTVFLAAGLMLAACSAPQPDELSPEVHFKEGEAYLEKGLYAEAITSWEKVRDSYYSAELTALAELKIAEAYFLDERYAEAASAYDDFLRQYPGDPRRGEITYQLGLSYYRQMLSPDRDQTATRNALAAFNDLLRLYPNERDAAEIDALIAECRERMAAHDLYVGRFYLRTKVYASAVKRLEELLQQHPQFSGNDEALYYLVRAYLKLEQRDAAEAAAQRLATAFPASPYLVKARDLLAE